MKKLLARALDRLRRRRHRSRPASSTTLPMSDGELAAQFREIQHTALLLARAPAQASFVDLRRLKGLAQRDAQSAERGRKVLGKSLALLPDPMPDTFLGPRTQPDFSKLDDE